MRVAVLRTFVIACSLCLKKLGFWPENSIVKHWFSILSFCPVLRIFCSRESEEKITPTAETYDLKQLFFLIHCILRSHNIQNILSSLYAKKCYYLRNFTPFFLIFGQNVRYSRLSGSQESPLPLLLQVCFHAIFSRTPASPLPTSQLPPPPQETAAIKWSNQTKLSRTDNNTAIIKTWCN